MPYLAMALRSMSISKYGLPMMRSAITAVGSTDETSLRSCSILRPTFSIDSRSGPFTFTPIGARMPLWSMTIRAAIGCSRGAEVVPGIFPASTISFQMSSGLRIPGQASRSSLRSGSNSGRQSLNGMPSSSGMSAPLSSRANLPRTIYGCPSGPGTGFPSTSRNRSSSSSSKRNASRCPFRSTRNCGW